MSTRAERLGGTEGNGILTNAAALLLIAEGVTSVLIGNLLSAHMFIGMALIGPVLLKLGSAAYRFARSYSGARIYREARYSRRDGGVPTGYPGWDGRPRSV